MPRKLVSERQYRRVEGVHCDKKPDRVVAIERPKVNAPVVGAALSGAPHYHPGQAGSYAPCDGTITQGAPRAPPPVGARRGSVSA